MPIDSSNLPISGGLLLAGMVYAGISLFLTGPLIAERTIEKSGWADQCEDALRAKLSIVSPGVV